MAYSDYGGYAYRNGVRVEERSDCSIKPDGELLSTPGQWPGFAKFALGAQGEDWPSGHVVLGEAPLYLTLRKQSTVRLFYGNRELDMTAMLTEPGEGDVCEFTDGRRYVDDDVFRDSGRVARFECEGVFIAVMWEHDDNYYVHARMEFPNGVTWSGWSGYGVGAGLEDAGYGYSTDDVEYRHREWVQDDSAEVRSDGE